MATFLNQFFNTKHIHEMMNKFPSVKGEYGYDAWGFNVKGMEPMMGIGQFLYEKYFRVNIHGLDHVSPKGRLLLIANHSGQIPLDGLLLGYALLSNSNGSRAAKAMVERFIPKIPFVNSFISQMGGVVGDPINCKRMLQKEEAIIVFPEGAKGINKPFSKRYQLQKFGTGFMHLAIENNTPIIPVGIVGMEESIVNIANLKHLAKAIKLPSFPIILPAIWPSKVIINIGKPMWFEKNDLIEERIIIENVDKVKEEIEQLIKKGLSERKEVFSA